MHQKRTFFYGMMLFTIMFLFVRCQTPDGQTQTPEMQTSERKETSETKEDAKSNGTNNSNSEVVVTYQVNEDMDIQVKFENQRTYNFVQLGLLILQRLQKDTNIPGITDPDFFPDYYAMISTEIDEGIKITEKQAKHFVNITYYRFRKRTVPEEYLKEPIKRKLLQFKEHSVFEKESSVNE